MNGVGEDAFQPGGSLTRAMFVTILGRMAGVAEGDYPGTSFADVPAGQWYSTYVTWAARTGVADGTGGGNFSPNRAVTREQMATMIARYTDSEDLTLNEVSDPVPAFTDQSAVSSWAREGVDLMRRTGILTGYEDGSFQPQRTANRAEAAAIFMRLDERLAAAETEDLTTQDLRDYFHTTDQVEQAAQPYLDENGYVDPSQTETLLDVVAAEAGRQKDQGAIVAYEREDRSVWMQLASGIQYVYLAPLENTSSVGEGTRMSILTYEPFSRWWETERPMTNQGANGAAATDGAADQIASAFVNYTFTDNYDDGEVTLDSLDRLSDNQVVLWDGHGGFSSRSHAFIALGEQLDETAFLWNPVYYLQNMEHTADYLTGRIICTSMEDRIAIGSDYIETYVDSMENSLVYLGACETGKDAVFANAFLDKGAAAVVGNSDTVLTDYTQAMQREILTCMTQVNPATNQYYTLEEALQYAREIHGDTDGAFGAQVVIFGGSQAREYRLGDNQRNMLQDLVGVYQGSYFATQGETGLTLTVYEENGTYQALFDFYNLPGRTNAKEGSYTMAVTVTSQGTVRFTAEKWIEQPFGYMLLDLEGTLQDDVLSGQSPTPFSVTKVSDTTDLGEKTPAQIAQAITETSEFTWNWFYDNQYTDKGDTIQAPYQGGTWTYERVTGLNSKAEVLALAQRYYDADTASEAVDLKEWVEQDGKLYVSATEGLGGVWPDRMDIQVERESALSYRITCREYLSGELYQPPYELRSSYQDGHWVFDQLLVLVGVSISA